jgi:hypothetical protein
MLDIGDDNEPPAKLREIAGTGSNPKEIASELPNAPTTEPLPKKTKLSAESKAEDEEWVEIDKESIPKNATVEDVEDEEEKPKF